MKQNLKRVILSTALAGSMIISSFTIIPTSSMVQAKSDTITYNNKIFTKKLYKNTKKIKFSSKAVKDQKNIKKVYTLLAKMKLKLKQPDENEEKKVGFVSVTIHTKDQKKKRYVFQGDILFIGSKTYTITKNNPVDEIRNIYIDLFHLNASNG